MKSKTAVILTLAALTVGSGAATAAQNESSHGRVQGLNPIERAVMLCVAQVGDAQTCEGMIYSGTQEGRVWLARGAAETLANNPGYATEKDPVRRAVMLCNAHMGDMQTCEGVVLSGTKEGQVWLAKGYAETLAKSKGYAAEKDPVRRAVMLCNAHTGDMQTCEGTVLSGTSGAWLETAKRD